MTEEERLSNNLETEENHEQWKTIVTSILLCFASIFLVTSYSFKSVTISGKNSNVCNCRKQAKNNYGYPSELIENLVRDKDISFVFPVYSGHAESLLNLLRSIRNLCDDCTQVPIIIITDDESQKLIHEILHKNHSLSDPAMKQSFPNLSIKLLRDVMPYYEANKWNDNSLLVNGKYLFQSHKKMFGVLNGASTRFSWVMDVDGFIFKPMSLAKILKNYLSLPYIFTAHGWSVGRDVFECAENLTGNFLSTGYTLEIMHWIYDREIVSDFNKVVLSQYPTWNIPILFQKTYFFEVVYYHFIMSNQILYRKYMEYRIVDVRTLLGGNFSSLLQTVANSANGGMIERIGYWKNPAEALENAEKQQWKSLADHLKKRINKTEFRRE
ncbi:hypothetical protein I4U23_028445 [Adineta vaga]|nr:hypothetical protein I4U23_028445 [Adineta vaga]